MAQPGMTLCLLKHRRVWQELDAQSQQRLETQGQREQHPRGSILWGPDDERGEVQMVLEGRLRVSRFDALGREIVVGILEEGELVCEEESMATHSGYVEALEPSEILRVRRVELQTLLDDVAPELGEALRRALAGDGARG